MSSFKPKTDWVKTIAGRRVYDRKPHLWRVTDLLRISRSLAISGFEGNNMTFPQWVEIQGNLALLVAGDVARSFLPEDLVNLVLKVVQAAIAYGVVPVLEFLGNLDFYLGLPGKVARLESEIESLRRQISRLETAATRK